MLTLGINYSQMHDSSAGIAHDGDDWWESRKLSVVINEFATHPEIGIVGHGLYGVDEQGDTEMGVTDLMRREWDARARKDAFHYIASWKRDWNAESFLESGEEDFRRLVAPVLTRCEIPLSGRAMLELGCGAGRMTGSFARRWERAYACDISPEMLVKAQSIHSEATNIVWLLSNGADLSCVAACSMDFVFSYLVLQHMPHEELVKHYIGEMVRVLKPGGAVLFHYHGGFAATMNWRGRVAWKLVDALWLLRLHGVSRSFVRLFGGDPEIAGKTWRGVSVSAQRIAEYVREAGGDVREMTGQGTPMAWCCAVRMEGTVDPGC